MEIITRAEAKAQGLKRFYTGKPCKHDHEGERYVCNNRCVECAGEHSRKWQKANPAKRRAINRKHHQTHREKRNKAGRERRAANPEKYREKDSRYARANPEKINAKNAERRARRLNQTPEWCAPGTEAYADMQDTYATAQALSDATGIDFVVDHIIPLAAGGEHRPDNLTPLKAETNVKKAAQLDFEYPENDFESVTEINTDDDDNFEEIRRC